MKVMLIHPAVRRMVSSPVPGTSYNDTGCYPPLGLLYIAAAALRNQGCEVSVLDANALDLSDREVEEHVRRQKPDLTGIQVMTFTLLDVLAAVRAVRRGHPATHLCLGGPHVWHYPEETAAFPEVDSLVVGEGEEVFPELIGALAAGRGPSGIPGVVFRGGSGTIRDGGRRPPIPDLDSLPFPARGLTPIDLYRSVLSRSFPITTMISSRGCPYRCIFCDRPHLGKTWRARSARSVVSEMKEIQELGIEEVFIYDDTFTISRERVIEICDLIRKEKVSIAWDVRARIDTVDEEMLGKMRRAGCVRIHYGVESGAPEILKILRKDIDLERAREVFRATRRQGIQTLGYFIIGNPSETRAQIRSTVDYALSIQADYAHWSLLVPYPGTDLYRMGLASGILPYDYWREFARNPTADFVPMVWEEVLKRGELLAELHRAYRRYYGRPAYLLRRVMEVRSWEELRSKASLAGKMFFRRDS